MTTSTTDAEAIARVIDPDAMVATTYIDDIGGRPLLTPSMSRRKEDALGKANRILSYLASRREAELEYIYDDERFNRGVQHVVAMLSRNLGVDNWVAGDGSEDYDEDLWQTVLNILAAKGLYDPDSGEFASRREAQEPVAWQYRYRPSGASEWSEWGDGKAPAMRGGTYDTEERPLYTAPPAPAGEVERPTPNERFIPRMLLLDDLHAVCVGGRWDGWKFYRHPDGQWVSLERLKEESAALNGGREKGK